MTEKLKMVWAKKPGEKTLFRFEGQKVEARFVECDERGNVVLGVDMSDLNSKRTKAYNKHWHINAREVIS